MLEAANAVSLNFSFLAPHSPQLVQLSGQAERYLHEDPNTCLIKLRQFSEVLVQQVAVHVGQYAADDTLLDTINRLRSRGVVADDVASLFHGLRKAGNAAAHSLAGNFEQALYQLRMARVLAVWFHQSFGKDPHFKPEPFVVPTDPRIADKTVAEKLAKLQADLEATRAAADAAQLVAKEATIQYMAAEAQVDSHAKDRAQLEAAVQEAERQFEAERQRMMQELTELQAKVAAAPAAEVQAVIQRAQTAGANLDLNEADTRRLVDQQLRDAGWEADTANLRYTKGVRPQKGKNIAIAEWPTKNGPADYVLFIGLQPVAVVEAKRKAKDVAASIEQSKRYSRGFSPEDGLVMPGGPWGDYKVPFLFATNGRPYLKQLETKSGIWFLDGRRSQNHPHALSGWYTPDGLQKLLAQDIAQANQALETETFSYLPLRDYQQDAIKAVEAGIAQGKPSLLVAMATGTGKTRTAIGMVYRMIKAKRFRRVLFLVDRSALGIQTANAFKDVRLENLQTFADIYDVKALGDVTPDPDTKLHITTVQSLVKRILYPSEGTALLPIDAYDCILVDECHRGYTLDRELSETELTFRSESEYISMYRRVLEYFDAVKIGLTATPALHTTEIFGEPIYQYSYRQAVIDGNLVDHEPPIRLITKLAEQGIVFQQGEQMPLLDVQSGALDLVHLPDEVRFEVDAFNKQVVTENFNKVVCNELVKYIDPVLPGKTLIFCATDTHADMVVQLLKNAYDAAYDGIDDDAIVKITGASDKPLEMIRRFKNEQHPKIAVTVDLLTTGIDVPEIVNIVFMRRVRSRILYEQMLGRATRLAPEIGKETFRIYDPVDLYAALEPVTNMKPVVTQPSITFEQLVEELQRVTEPDAQKLVLDQLVAKLQRKAKKLKESDGFETLAGMPPAQLLDQLRRQGPADAASWFAAHADLALYLDRVTTGDGPKLVISEHDDELLRTERGYGEGQKKPDDYLDEFGAFILDNMNLIPALTIVTQRPRELTRKQLKVLQLELDKKGFNETHLRTAWQEVSNEDIAASIIGFIRQRALGSPLMPYAERVDKALKRILASRQWTPPQRQWLERIGKQMVKELIVDADALDQGVFKSYGGFAQINKTFGGQLGQVLTDLQDQVWKDAG